jgi:hypothetical protein
VPQIWDVENVLDVDRETIRGLDVEGATTHGQDAAASGDTSVAAADVVDHLVIVQ